MGINLTPNTQEQYSSHIPALATLMRMGWEFLPEKACTEFRGGHREVLLKPVLIEQLKNRRFEYKGEWHSLPDQAIDQIVRELSTPGLNQGLLTANEGIYNTLTLGVTVTVFMPDGKKATPTIAVIDWDEFSNNHFQVSEEFTVLSSQGTHTRRPDLICFINGIPLAVIEAKRPDSGNPNKSMVTEGISQSIRNQKPDEIPQLFAYSQLLLSISVTEGRYGTTHTPAKFWARWQEEEIDEGEFDEIKNRVLSARQHESLFADKTNTLKSYFESLWNKPVLTTDQDRLIISLLKPERLLEFIQYFILFDRKVGKIAARYQQAFGIKALLKRIGEVTPTGNREGGVVWHTTGSGKSFTMVYLCKSLLLAQQLKDCRVVVVTDRVDLEKQLAATFLTGGAFGGDIAGKKLGDDLAKAKTGRQLAKRIGKGNERIIFTIINKFASATKLPECYNPSANIIVLIDEAHRSQGGENHERMRQALPNAAYVAFTGTPLLKDDKTTNKFGPIVHAYTMKKAVNDKTVTPLLYEERKPQLDVNAQSIDNWFDKITAALSDEQKADLKKKFSSKGTVYGASRRIEMIAWDISIHFDENFKQLDQGLKGQLACDSKLSAIRYKNALDEIGSVTSRIIISPTDTREGHESVNESTLPEVQQWWKDNISGDPQDYEKQVIEDFSTEGEPDLLIVVDKLLTGFDEPRNAVLYIDKPLRQHNLIQAIARVNRLHEQKQYGLLIDYRGILKELDATISDYQDLEKRTQGGFDIDDLEGLYSSIDTEYKRLPGLHDQLWSIFKDVDNRQDTEQYRQVLMPKYAADTDGDERDIRQPLREDFYNALTEFGLCLKVALSSSSFFEDRSFSEDDISTYKKDLRWFSNLRKIVRQDAQETIDYSLYEKQIRKLVDKDVTATGVEESRGVYVVGELGGENPESWNDDKTRNETDLIKTRIKKTIEQALANNPYAQKVFSDLLKEAIEEAESLFDYPKKQFSLLKDLEDKIESGSVPDTPEALTSNPHAQAYFGIFKLKINDQKFVEITNSNPDLLVDEALAIDDTVKQAVAENSVNPQGIEAQIRKNLLPRLFSILGLDSAKVIIDEIIRVMNSGVQQ